MRTRTARVRALQTSWLEDGPVQGPIMIFLHGCPDGPECWRGQLEHFAARGARVVAPYARGLEPSPLGRDPARAGRNAIALDHLEILRSVAQTREEKSQRRSVFVFGHDIGAIHAWALARLLGPRLAALVTINGPDLAQMAARVTNLKQLAKSWYIAAFQLPGVAEALLGRFEPQLVARASVAGGRSGPTGAARITPFLAQYRQAARELPGFWMRGGGSEPLIEAPVLALWSSDDAFLEPPTLGEYDTLGTDVTLRVLTGGHWVHAKADGRVSALVDRFIDEKGLEAGLSPLKGGGHARTI